MPTDDLDRFCCQNPGCGSYGRRGEDTILVIDHFGKARHRLLYCKVCKARSSEFKGTPFFNSKLPHDKVLAVLAVLEHLAEGCGVRQTARLVGVNKDTVNGFPCWLASTPRPPTTSWWPFPPSTREVQFDEKWAFVGKKRKSCDPANPDDDHCGDYWDHVAFDPEHKLVLAVIPGARVEENAYAVVAEVKQRVGNTPPPLMTSDEYPAYATAIEAVFSEPVPTPPRRGPGRPRIVPERRMPAALVYATVHKEREDNRVIAVEPRQVFGTPEALGEILAESTASRRVNTSFLERQNATDRHRNARKARKTYRFNKDWQVHEAMTYLTLYGYNFCRCVRTLRVKDEQARWQPRTPAFAAKLTDHVWTWEEWFTRPTIQSP